MSRVKHSLQQAVQLIEANIAVLRSDAGALAHEGKEDESIDADHAAVYLQASTLLIVEAIRRAAPKQVRL